MKNLFLLALASLAFAVATPPVETHAQARTARFDVSSDTTGFDQVDTSVWHFITFDDDNYVPPVKTTPWYSGLHLPGLSK